MKRDPYRTPKLPTPTPPAPHDLWDVDPTPTTIVERTTTRAVIKSGDVTLTVRRHGPLDSDAWPDWWIVDQWGNGLRRVRGLEEGVCTARAMAVKAT